MTTLSPSCSDCDEIWKPQPPGTFGACPGLHGDRVYHTNPYGFNIGDLYSLILFTELFSAVFNYFLPNDATRRPPTTTHCRLKLTTLEAITQKVVYDKG